MAQFRAKKLDLGCFINIKNIRDHTKRKVFEENEPERCAILPTNLMSVQTWVWTQNKVTDETLFADKPSDT